MKIIRILILMTLSAIFTSCGLDTSKKGTSASTLKTKVENVKIKKEHSNAWAVTGMIRNESSVNIKGAVKIKFLNSKGDVVHNNRAKVNGGDPINPGQAGNFEYFTDPDKFDDVNNFDIEFYER